MTDEMLDLARANQAKAGVENVHWLKGHIEAIPLPADTVDVVLSNCVINLSTDKPQVLREAARVLKPGGRFAVSDVIADPDMDDATRADMQQYVGCIAGALTHDEYTRLPHRRRPDRHRDHRDPPRPRARRLGDHPRPQALVSRQGRCQAPAGWNSSIGLPAGSSSRICRPPGPLTMSFRNEIPAARSCSTSASMSPTMKCTRFQPPGSGVRPSGIGRPAELFGPLSSSRRPPRTTSANAGAALVRRLEAEVGRVVDGGLDVIDHVADVHELVRHARAPPACLL